MKAAIKRKTALGIALSLCLGVFCLADTGPQAWGQSSDSSHPEVMTQAELSGAVEPGGQSRYYSFSGGPGNLTVKLSGETDFYTSTTHAVFTDDKGRELANIPFTATSSGSSKTATIHLDHKQTVKIQLIFGTEVGVKVKYKVALSGPLSFSGGEALAHSNRPVQNMTNTAQPAVTVASLPATKEITVTEIAQPPAQAASAPIEDKWALVVGISKFAKPSINLSYPAKDARDLAAYLTTDGKFAPDHVKVLTDEEATKERVMAELGDKWLPRLARPNDLVLIFISTHGSPSTADLEGLNYLVMHNTDPDSLYATGLPLSELAAAIKSRVHSNRVVLIVDACHSGAANPAKGLTRKGNFDSDALMQGTGQMIICSSAPNQVSWESKRYPNGVFTRQLIEALKAGGVKGTLGQAFDRLKEATEAEVLRDRGELQSAVLKTKWQGEALILSAPPTKPRPL